eukprot:g32465.t1
MKDTCTFRVGPIVHCVGDACSLLTAVSLGTPLSLFPWCKGATLPPEVLPDQKVEGWCLLWADPVRTSPDNHDYDHPLPAEVIDSDWAESFLNPPIFDNDDEVAHTSLSTYDNAQADSLSEVPSQVKVDKVKAAQGDLPQKVSVSAAFALSTNLLHPNPKQAHTDNWTLDFYTASQRQLRRGTHESEWWSMANDVTELL